MSEQRLYEMTLAARKDARQTAGNLHYSPWVLALSVSLAWALLIFGTVGAYHAAGGWAAFGTAVLIAPFPALVTAWVRKAWQVEGSRLDLARDLLGLLPAVPAPEEEPEPEEAGPVTLTPGYDLHGEIVAVTTQALTPEAEALRDVCLRFVRGGMRRDGWSRKKLAEGDGKWMSGDDWSKASRELQRLGYFRNDPAGLTPARDLGDILKRLEAAR